jgi:glyceraldehyde-3-phosphate dehydrogenase (NADP+)
MDLTVQQEQINYTFLLNDEWRSSESNRFIDIFSPSNQELVGRVPMMTMDEANSAIE